MDGYGTKPFQEVEDYQWSEGLMKQLVLPDISHNRVSSGYVKIAIENGHL